MSKIMARIEHLPVSPDHPNYEGHAWLCQLFEVVPAEWRQYEEFADKADNLPEQLQIAVLKACVECMPFYRKLRTDRSFHVGAICYVIACRLFKKRSLHYTEADICQILRYSEHSCGHGSDVRPPYEIMLQYVRSHGVSQNILAATRDFVDGLKSVRSSIAQNIKSEASVFLLLDDGPRQGRCWSDAFRLGLKNLPQRDQQLWQQFVMNINKYNKHKPGKQRLKIWQDFISQAGADNVVARLTDWWPRANEDGTCRIQSGGSNLLQHFIWLLVLLSKESRHQAECDNLIFRLTALDWKPSATGANVMLSAADFVLTRPPAVASVPLGRIQAWLLKNVKRLSGRATMPEQEWFEKYFHGTGYFPHAALTIAKIAAHVYGIEATQVRPGDSYYSLQCLPRRILENPVFSTLIRDDELGVKWDTFESMVLRLHSLLSPKPRTLSIERFVGLYDYALRKDFENGKKKIAEREKLKDLGIQIPNDE